MNTKGFIFDLDGVIVDTAKYHYLAWKKLTDELGIYFDETLNEQLKGVSRKDSLTKILAWGNITLSDDEFLRQMTLKNNNYLAYINTMKADEILPGVVTILKFLKKVNQPIALGSASKNARSILKKVNLLEMFTTIIDGNDVSIAKPNPEVFLKAAQGLQIKPEDCIVFEDSVAGIEAANSAGMTTIGIGNQEILHKANVVFNDFTEIRIEFIEELIKK